MSREHRGDLVHLSDRMQAVADLVPKGSVVADVGTDHGYIPIYLIQNRIACQVLALDLRKGPLHRAERHIKESGLEGQIRTRLSDGLANVSPGEVDTVVISGMGGPLMIRILQSGREVVDDLQFLILQPQSEVGEVRQYLTETHLTIRTEDMVEEDGKYYPIMRVIPGETEHYEMFEYRYGKKLIEERHPVLKSYLETERAKLERLLQQLSEGEDSPHTQARKEELSEELAVLDQAWENFSEKGES